MDLKNGVFAGTGFAIGYFLTYWLIRLIIVCTICFVTCSMVQGHREKMAEIKNKIQTIEVVDPGLFGKTVGVPVRYSKTCNIRKGPGIKYRVVGTVELGKEYFVLAKKGQWRMIESFAHKIAWVGCKLR